ARSSARSRSSFCRSSRAEHGIPALTRFWNARQLGAFDDAPAQGARTGRTFMTRPPRGAARRKLVAQCTCCRQAWAADSRELPRRAFLAGGLAALGAAAAGPAPAATTPIAKTRIDVHHHFLPDAHRAALDKHKMGSPKWSPQMSLDDMDQSG